MRNQKRTSRTDHRFAGAIHFASRPDKATTFVNICRRSPTGSCSGAREGATDANHARRTSFVRQLNAVNSATSKLPV